jgi:hypothetical protein
MRILIFIVLKIAEVGAAALCIAAAAVAGMPTCFLLEGRWTPKHPIDWLGLMFIGALEIGVIYVVCCGLCCLIKANWRRAGEIAEKLQKGS